MLQAGGFPIELPAISLAEAFVKPTTMLYRNMLAMETEELLRSHPVDGAVLMGGCDKTTPGLLMGAMSAGPPCIYLPAAPMLRGNYKGQTLGSGSDAWKLWDERRAGKISRTERTGVEAGIARSHGTCMTMGTAATMMGIAEAIGMTLPGASWTWSGRTRRRSACSAAPRSRTASRSRCRAAPAPTAPWAWTTSTPRAAACRCWPTSGPAARPT